jgi:hypothetical protein
MVIEFEHNASVEDHVEKLVKAKAKAKELKRTDLIEGLILLKQLKHNNLNRPDFSPIGCIPASYQQISADSDTSSGIVEYLTVVDNGINENDIIDVDTLDESAVLVARTPLKAEPDVDHDDTLLNDDNHHDADNSKDASSSGSSIPNDDLEKTAWTGADDETYTGDLVDGVFHCSGTYTSIQGSTTKDKSMVKARSSIVMVTDTKDNLKTMICMVVVHTLHQSSNMLVLTKTARNTVQAN